MKYNDLSYNKSTVKNRRIRLKNKNMAFFWIYLNCRFYLAAFATALSRNSNFNLVLVGVIYLIPLIPLGIDPECLQCILLSLFPT